jgi:hypothetical protein
MYPARRGETSESLLKRGGVFNARLITFPDAHCTSTQGRDIHFAPERLRICTLTCTKTLGVAVLSYCSQRLAWAVLQGNQGYRAPAAAAA